MPITTPVPEEYATKFDASTPSTYDQYVGLHRPVHGQERRQDRQARRARRPGKSITIVRNPNWDKSTDYRPAYLDEINIRRATTTWPPPRAARPERAGTCVLRRLGAPPAPVLKQAVHDATRTRCRSSPSGGTRYIALNTHGQAVRQHQHPQGDHRGLRPQRPAPDARRRDPRRHRHRLDPAGHPGLRGGRRPEAEHRPRLPAEPAAVTRRWRRSTCSKRGRPDRASGKWTGGEQLLTIATTPTRARRPPRSSRARSRSSGFKLNFRDRARRTRCTRSSAACRKANVAICPNVGLVQGLRRPAVDARRRRSTARTSSAGQRQLAAARRAGDQRAMKDARDRPDRRGAQQGVGRRSTT